MTLWEKVKRLIRLVSWDQWDAIDADWMGKPPPPGPLSHRGRTVLVLVSCAAILATLEYYGSRSFFRAHAPDWARPEGWHQLAEYGWWCGTCVFGYLVVPALLTRALLKERLVDYGFRTEDFFKHLWIYAALFAAVSPMVFTASLTEAFQRKYPFYALATRSPLDFFAWEAMYSAQFVALEFFFRGFLLFGLARHIGSAAIVVMAVPYCMIHFGKPFPETIGAIGAGMVLGTIALRTRSIYAGILIHVAVAWSMDLLSLSHKGLLSKLWGQ